MSRRPATESDIPMHGWAPYHTFHRERIHAHAKHSATGKSSEQMAWNDPFWIPVVVEELSEACREIQTTHGGLEHLFAQLALLESLAREFNDFPGECTAENVSVPDRLKLRNELIQVGAMVAAWIDAIEDGFDDPA